MGHKFETPSVKSDLQSPDNSLSLKEFSVLLGLAVLLDFCSKQEPSSCVYITNGRRSCTSVYAQLGCCPNICVISSSAFTGDAFRPKCCPRTSSLFLSAQIASRYVSAEEEREEQGEDVLGLLGGVVLCCVVCEGRGGEGGGGRAQLLLGGGIIWLCLRSHQSGC